MTPYLMSRAQLKSLLAMRKQARRDAQYAIMPFLRREAQRALAYVSRRIALEAQHGARTRA